MRAQDDSALIFLQRSQNAGGNHPRLDHQLGNVYFMQRKYDLARYHYRRAIAGDSTVLEYWVALGTLEFMQKNYEAAEKVFFQALRIDSLAEKPLNFLFEIYAQGYGDWEGARKRFAEPLLNKDPFHPLGNFLMGLYFENLYRKTKKDDHGRRALHFFTQALLAKPDYAQVLYHRAYLYFEVKKYEAAAEDLGDYLRLRPEDARAYFLLGSIYEYWGRKELACENYHKAWLYDLSFTQARQAWEEICP
ncbi:MAG: tetratricopeptide repeat protein [Bacteroidia bacterium]